MSDTTTKTIGQALAAVMGDVQAVGKDDKNQQQGYSFRGVDAVVNAVGPALRRHGVLVVPQVEDAAYREVEVGKNRTLQRECTLRVRYGFYGPNGDSIEAVVVAEALDSGDKATAKAHSVAFRTCLLQVFAIPTDDVDPDASSPERAKKVTTASAPKTPKPEQPVDEVGRAKAYKELWDLIKDKKLDSKDVSAKSESMFGISSTKELSEAQCRELMTALAFTNDGGTGTKTDEEPPW